MEAGLVVFLVGVAGLIVVLATVVYSNGYTTGRSEGIDHEKERWRAELVEKKLGRWKVDPATGDSWFSIGSQ